MNLLAPARPAAAGPPASGLSRGTVALALAGLLLLTFPTLVFGTHTFFFRDFGTLAYPLVHYQREAFWRGEFPFWNPLSHGGTPFFAQWNTLALYPGALLYLLLPLPWSLNLFCLLHLFLAGLGMAALARRWTGSAFGAAVAAVAYAFGGAMLSSHIYPNYLVALGWMPWVIAGVGRAVQHGRRTLVSAAAVSALQMLSGAPEILLLTWLLALALATRQILLGTPAPGTFAAESGVAVRRRKVGRFVAVAAATAGLAAFQLLPFFDLLAHSQRGSDFGGQLWTMPVWGWASFLVPRFHCFETPQGLFYQTGQAFLGSYYAGAGVLALALLAFGQPRAPRLWLVGGLTLLSLLLALGDHTFVYPTLRGLLPPLGFARFPVKAVYLATFLLPLLAAYGVKVAEAQARAGRLPRGVLGVAAVCAVAMAGIVAWAASAPTPREDWTVTARSAAQSAAFLGLTLGVVYGLPRFASARLTPALSLLLLAVVWLDLRTHTPHLTPVLPHAILTDDVVELRPKPGLGDARVFITPRAERLLMTRTLPDFGQDFLGARLALWSNLNAQEGIPKVNGAATLAPRHAADLEAALYAAATNDLPRPLLRFLGVSHVSSPANPVEWLPWPDRMPLITAGQEPRPTPDAQAWHTVLSPAFQPGSVVLLPPEAAPAVAGTGRTAARVGPADWRGNRIEFDVAATAPAMVVIAQSFYPRWYATVDDRPTPLWRANFAYQALQVPAGTHRVRLRYVESSWRPGALLSLVTLAGLGVVWVRAGRRGRRR